MWEITREVGERLVDALAPSAGETILELAAGPGDTGFLAAQRLGPGGRLISTDLVPEMVEAARARAAELGLENAEFRVADAQRLDLPSESVDAVLCRWGYMLLPDPAAGLAETSRVLRPGGRLAFAVWAEADRNPWGAVAGRALIRLGLLEPPAPDAPGPFRLGDVARVRSLVAGAGFEEPVVEEVALTWRYPSFEDWWRVSSDLSSTLSSALRRLSAAETERLRATAAELLAPYAGPEGLAVPGVCRTVLTRRPG